MKIDLKTDPILAEVYAAKEALSAKYGHDLHAIAEALRRSPLWKPVKRPARRLKTAEARRKRLLDEGETMRELYKVKEVLSAEYARERAKEDPSRKPLAQPTAQRRARTIKPKPPSKPKFRSTKSQPK